MTVTINGTTGVSLVQDATITQPKVATGVAGNGPAFSAWCNVPTTLTNSAYTKVPFNVEEYDTNNNYDSTTNYRFQPTVAGYYQINANVLVGGATTIALLAVLMYKNGALFKGGNNVSGSTQAGSSISSLVFLNGSTDYVEFFAYITGTGTLALSNASTNTYVNGFLARAA